MDYIDSNNITEVDIIGGSHSGFSVAWMLLNGSAMYDFGNENLKLPKTEKFTHEKFYLGENYEYLNWKIPPFSKELKINIIFWDKIWVYYKNI